MCHTSLQLDLILLPSEGRPDVKAKMAKHKIKKKLFLRRGSEYHALSMKQVHAMKAWNTVTNRERSHRKRWWPWGLLDLLKSRPLATTNTITDRKATCRHAGRCPRHRNDRLSQHNRYHSQAPLISHDSSHAECAQQSSFDTASLLTPTALIYNTSTSSPISFRTSLPPPLTRQSDSQQAYPRSHHRDPFSLVKHPT